MPLRSLRDLDEMIEGNVRQLPCLVHEDHRWLLPMMQYAQERQWLPKPVTLVMFDQHHDALDPLPHAMHEIRRIRQAGPSVDELIRLSRDVIRPTDDDWVLVGMELGLIGDAVMFGVDDRMRKDLTDYVDHAGEEHLIAMLELPGQALGHQGSLGDTFKRMEYGRVWEIIGWDPNHGFIGAGDSKILLDVDLDLFMVTHSGPSYPWPDIKFESAFLDTPPPPSLPDWSGKRLFQGLLAKAGLLTIARESECCADSHDNCDEILGKVNHFLLDGQLHLDGETSAQWWGYIDPHGTVRVMAYTHQRVVDEARANPDISEVYGPFSAEDKKDAMIALLVQIAKAQAEADVALADD